LELRAAKAAKEATLMSKNAKIAAGGVAAGLILLIWLPWWAALLIVLGVPAAAYLALDPSQRRRLRRTNSREIGR
jgi:membrane protein implicated in regulation of membrane protease activity